jgi:altronate dehydratase large subunit
MPSAFQIHASDNVATLSGKVTLHEAAVELMDQIANAASGAPSKPEMLGHREFFLMYKHQDAPSLEAGCRA